MSLADTETQITQTLADINNALTQAKAAGTHINEAMTEMFVIDPLLRVLGYQPWEMHKQGHDATTGKYPDYTLLPGTTHKWFLEAKRLDLVLKDGEAEQAVNYASNQGAQWAVLTNGRTWYIYNAHLHLPLTEKRVFQIDNLLDMPEAVQLLSLLSRASMQSDGLTEAWAAERLTAFVREQMQTPGSAARKYLRKMAGTELGTSISEEMLTRALATVFAVPPSKKPQIIVPPPIIDPFGPGYVLEQLAQNAGLTTKRRPAAVRVASGAWQAVKTWSGVARLVVAAVGAAYGLPPLPFVGSTQGEKLFLNTQPLRADGKPMITVAEAQVDTQTIYLDMNRSAQDTVRVLVALLKSVSAPLDTVKITLADTPFPETINP